MKPQEKILLGQTLRFLKLAEQALERSEVTHEDAEDKVLEAVMAVEEALRQP